MVRLAPTVTVSDLDSVREIDDYVMKRLPQNINTRGYKRCGEKYYWTHNRKNNSVSGRFFLTAASPSAMPVIELVPS